MTTALNEKCFDTNKPKLDVLRHKVPEYGKNSSAAAPHWKMKLRFIGE